MLTTFYCYFCEQRLFPHNKSKRLEESQYTSSSEGGQDKDKEDENKTHLGNLLSNMTACIPKDLRSRKEVSAGWKLSDYLRSYFLFFSFSIPVR